MERSVSALLKCSYPRCRQDRWEQSPFCFQHVLNHLASSLWETDREILRNSIEAVLKSLTFREREIIKLRYGIDDGHTYTLEEVGRVFKLTQSQVRRVEAAAIKTIKPQELAPKILGVDDIQFSDANEHVAEAVKVCKAELVKYFVKHPEEMRTAAPDVFERLIAEVLESFGLRVQMTKKSWDDGVDVIAFEQSSIPCVSTKFVVQCKRFAAHRPVDVDIVRSLWGVRDAERADHAILATTSYFSTGALRFCKKPAVLNMHLKDFDAIKEWLQESNARGYSRRHWS